VRDIESGTRLLVYVDPAVPEAAAHDRVAAARAVLQAEPMDIVRADAAQAHADVEERHLTHISDIGPGEPTAEYLGVWMTLVELEALAEDARGRDGRPAQL
jgi:hypothetical protein